VAALDHDGDLRGVEVVLVARLRDPLSGMEVIEAKFSHLAALRERLTAAVSGRPIAPRPGPEAPRRTRITVCYANCMAQVVARLDDRLMAEVDALVADGVVANRSAAVRLALERLVDAHRRRRVGAQIVAAYRRQPQTEDELAGLDEATRALVSQEPW
jgi:Arc/MetJ-type ribon-helix-helix transcriptional regulator